MENSFLISLITCTGTRPEAFALCEKWMGRQTAFKVFPFEWIVVDDGPVPINCTMGQTYVRGPKQWEEGINTHRYNMDAALEKVRGDYIFVIEDDDFYTPEYIETMIDLMRFVPVVGEGTAKYYNLKIPGYKEMRNREHASLCQTALRSTHKDLLYKAVHSGELYFDIHLWRTVIDSKIPSILVNDTALCIGMKGLPGRTGIGAGHKKEKRDYYLDAGGRKLKEWLGSDAQYYESFLRKKDAGTERKTETLRQGDRGVLQPGWLKEKVQGAG